MFSLRSWEKKLPLLSEGGEEPLRAGITSAGQESLCLPTFPEIQIPRLTDPCLPVHRGDLKEGQLRQGVTLPCQVLDGEEAAMTPGLPH